MLPLEVLLPVALPAIYLLDSVHFLSIGEAAITTRAGSIRGLSCGARFELGGRRLLLPNPLTPFWPELRLEWITSSGARNRAEQARDEMIRCLRAARPIGRIGAVCALLIIIVAPLALLLGNERWFVASAALSFALTVAACALVGIRRRDLGLTRAQACSSVLVALVCAPCAPNLARGILLHRRWTLRAPEVLTLGFDKSHLGPVRQTLETALSDALRFVPEESAEQDAISEQLQELREAGRAA